MPNIKNKESSQARSRFIQGMAEILVPLGVPQTAARLYGYLLLSDAPLSLDRIVADLEISKSTASVAAQLLVMYTLVRRSGERGSRRVLFEPSEDYSGMINAQMRSLEQLTTLIKEGAKTSASRKTRDRLTTMADFYLVNRKAMELAQREWSARK